MPTSLEPAQVQCLADRTGSLSICGQRVGLGRSYARRTMFVTVSESTLAVQLDDGDFHVVRRTNAKAVTTMKARPPRTVTKMS